MIVNGTMIKLNVLVNYLTILLVTHIFLCDKYKKIIRKRFI